MTILVEGSTPADIATQANLKQWIGRAGVRGAASPYTATLDSVDPQPGMETYFNVPRDQFITVDLQTMKFIDIWNTDPMSAINEVEGLLPAATDAGMPDM